ncbi:putative sulfate exporter family transporter [Thalassobius vesicularis]|uniref:Putative sulfate exporter family transporter n=1 Tax=Thalassobius vesicularis TaxID=1294297 RepID=A0A4S3M6C9_9RHOB|nr:putative sulfate exporter family transporter [Thalassobius vesicularis]THD71615.1 putative sulfate exporter family transporter [Thalassobius vesicularis]
MPGDAGNMAGRFVADRYRGVLIAVIVATAAKFLSEHYGAPAMLMALLLGIAFNFLSEGGACQLGIEFSARTILRIGVALLGVRISIETMIGLGPALILTVIAGVVLTILFGILAARVLGRSARFGVMTGGAVAICGASAAMAIAAILPKSETSERDLTFTVLGVTILSTLAMITYPILTATFDFDARAAGVFLGGTIHDVAQVVGAGYSISEETGDVATLVKLIRVAMLAPVVLVISLIMQRRVAAGEGAKRPPLLPLFVIGFLALGAANSMGLIPGSVTTVLSTGSQWALLTAIAAVGMKTSLKTMFDIGGQAIALIVGETLFIILIILTGVHLAT